jgi:hypothetical protein
MVQQIEWDKTGEKKYETGVDHGVLYPLSTAGVYAPGVPWNGLTTVTETPSGAESNPVYADNIKYIDLQSAEEFAATIEALYYPDEFEACDGSATVGGVTLGQQDRQTFGLSYRTLVGNDVANNNYGYKLHLLYGAKAAPSERAYSTVNDSPEPIGFSWECSTTPVNVGTIAGKEYKPTALVTIDSTDPANTPAKMAAIQKILYGTAATTGATPTAAVPARMPTPAEVYNILNAAA